MQVEYSEEEIKKRKEILKILCILTFIGSGLSALSGFSMFLMIDTFRNFFEQGMFDFMSEQMDMGSFETMLYINRSYFLINALLSLGTIFGAYLMWNFKKFGFHIYTISQIILLIIPQLFISGFPFPTFELMVTGVFVYLYSRQLPLMK